MKGEVIEKCLKCGKMSYIIEAEGILSSGEHYPIGYCKDCKNNENT